MPLRGTGILVGLMARNTKVSGRVTEFMGKGTSFGLMEGVMMVSMSMERRKVLGSLFGLTGEFIEASGRVGSRMEEESLFRGMGWKKLASGVMARRSDGFSDVFFNLSDIQSFSETQRLDR